MKLLYNYFIHVNKKTCQGVNYVIVFLYIFASTCRFYIYTFVLCGIQRKHVFIFLDIKI